MDRSDGVLIAGTKWLSFHKGEYFVNQETDEKVSEPPMEVLSILTKKNAEPANSQNRKIVYEKTKHEFRMPLALDASATRVDDAAVAEDDGIGRSKDVADTAKGLVRRTDLLKVGPKNVAFFLENFLSPAECLDVIAQAEAFGLEDSGYSRNRRITQRVVIHSEAMAETLFSRILPFLEPAIDIGWNSSTSEKASDSDPQNHLKGIGLLTLKHGTWRPVGLNPTFRVCRYECGGFFTPHYDEGFAYSTKHLSLKTLMVYLNTDFLGAPTNFYDDTQQHYTQGHPEKVIEQFSPTTFPNPGSCLVFNSAITHDGGRLESGLKYILRSEIMYKWDGDEEADSVVDDDDDDFDDIAVEWDL